MRTRYMARCFAVILTALCVQESNADVRWVEVSRNGYARFEPGTTRNWGGEQHVVGDWTAELMGGPSIVGQTRAIVNSGPVREDGFFSTIGGTGWMNPGVAGFMTLEAGDDIEFDVTAVTPVRLQASLEAQSGTAGVLLQEVSPTAEMVGLPKVGRTLSVSATAGSRGVGFTGVLKPGRYRYAPAGRLTVQASGQSSFVFSADLKLGPHELVADVGSITSAGSPGSVFTSGAEWVSIASGDDDATFPSTVVAARSFGTGRVVLLGHDGLLSQFEPLDNKLFQRNAMKWLNGEGIKRVGVTTGHSEWVTLAQLTPLRNQLAAEGYAFQQVTAPLAAAKLQNVSVLIAGNAWGSFTADEVHAVKEWVESGGGLLLTGLGWSWLQYHPGTTFADYPMTQLGNPYGAYWLPGGIVDPTDQYEGSPVFHRLYPEALNASVDWATATILADHSTYAGSLPFALQIDTSLRLRFSRAHQILALPSQVMPTDHPERGRVRSFYASLFPQYPGLYRRAAPLSPTSAPTAAWIRERAFATVLDYGPPNAGEDAAVATLAEVTGIYRDLLVDHGIAVLDNLSLDDAQRAYLRSFFALLPDSMDRPRAISVRDFLGTPPATISLLSSFPAVNIFGSRIGDSTENQFPADVPPGLTDVFCIVVAHEANHIVDAVYVARDDQLRARRDDLIARAGPEPLNYLRSMLPAGFFVENPQEFVASISNQWFADSDKTFALAFARFDAGRPEPLNQAMFFAELYSVGGPRVHIYAVSPQGDIVREFAPVRRDDRGRIVEIALRSGRFVFDLDEIGNVTEYARFCVADLTVDGVVDFGDYLEFLNLFDAQDARADLNMDGLVDFADYLEFLTLFDGGC